MKFQLISCKRFIAGWRNLVVSKWIQIVFNNQHEKQKTKRRKRTNKHKPLPDENNLEIYYNNVNGLLSKQDSFSHIIQMRQPDIVTLCETKLHKNSKFEVPGYEVIKSNLKAGKEGILVALKVGTFNNKDLIFESENRNIATAEIIYPEDTLRIVVVHGPQEEAQQEEREEFYNDLKAEIERCIASGSRLLITGDFNARLENTGGKIESTKSNGKMLIILIQMTTLLNRGSSKIKNA